jgi:pimeloyl-ACP methyl ester carboxylesterase
LTGARIDRGFVRIDAGQVHYREAGRSGANGPLPLYLAHAGPGSSRGLEGLIADLGLTRHAIAPDMLGNGDSDPPAMSPTTVADYVEHAVGVMDAIGLRRVDFYGSHTGAQIGVELAVAHPGRVRRLVIDGLPLFSPQLKSQLLARYAPAIAPDDHGGQLAWAWTFVRDQTFHFPYYARDPEHRLANTTAPPAGALHDAVVDVLRSLRTYHLAYQAAFSQDVAALLPRLKTPTLVMGAETDPLSVYLDDVAAMIPNATVSRTSRTLKAQAIRAFLD